jgi:hypothetical protein
MFHLSSIKGETVKIRIAFKNVKVGDRVYQHNYYARNKWRKVTSIETEGDLVTIFLGVSVHPNIDTRLQMCGHKEEGITIKRGKQR